MKYNTSYAFSDHLEKHVQRLGIAGVLAAFAAAGDSITRRTLETWRYKRWPRPVIQRGAVAILAEAKPKRLPAGNGDAAQS